MALVVPSPKLHCQEVGLPEVVSMNCTGCPDSGAVGLKTKVAGDPAGMTVSVLVNLRVTTPSETASVTLRNPDAT